MKKTDETTGKPERPGFDRRMTREEINTLPIQRYDGPVEVIRNRAELTEAVGHLLKEKVLGFDTETRPSFKKGESYPPALIQLTGKKTTYIFQLRHLKFPRALRALLSNPNIIKAGVALGNDVRMLMEVAPFRPQGMVDLGDVAKRAGIKNYGLRGLSAVLLGYRISKSAQVSNWARNELTPSQIVYAATDSWVSRDLFLRLQAMGVSMSPDHTDPGAKKSEPKAKKPASG